MFGLKSALNAKFERDMFTNSSFSGILGAENKFSETDVSLEAGDRLNLRLIWYGLLLKLRFVDVVSWLSFESILIFLTFTELHASLDPSSSFSLDEFF